MTGLRQSAAVVRVQSQARLHLGFLDLHGYLGRQYGSLGVAIDAFATCLTVASAEEDLIRAIDPKKIMAIRQRFFQTLGAHIPEKRRTLTIDIQQQIPEHAGLGSGTQLALCLGTALCRLYEIPATTHEIAMQLGRGQRSGIGISTFEHGGFVVDGGSDDPTRPPPLLVQMAFPQSWRILLVMDTQHQGVHGPQERLAFQQLPAFPEASAQRICHLTLMKLLPALAERRCRDFGEAVTEIQSVLGQHFSPAQGGRPYTSDAVAQLLHYAVQAGVPGIAQSSWGPTGCIFVDSEIQARQLQAELEQFAQVKRLSSVQIRKTSGYNHGASIEIHDD